MFAYDVGSGGLAAALIGHWVLSENSTPLRVCPLMEVETAKIFRP